MNQSVTIRTSFDFLSFRHHRGILSLRSSFSAIPSSMLTCDPSINKASIYCAANAINRRTTSMSQCCFVITAVLYFVSFCAKSPAEVVELIEKCGIVFQSSEHVGSSHRVRRSRSTSEEFIMRMLLLKVIHRWWLLLMNRRDQIGRRR